MNELLADVLAAHGGLRRWQAVTAITASGSFGGLLRARFPGNRMAEVTVRVLPAEQQAIFERFPEAGRRAIFDRGDVRIETRTNARAAFSGLGGLRRKVRWDALDAAYFAGCAWWNYLSAPLLLTRDGVTVTEADPRLEHGERRRRLDVRFPPDIPTHSPRQTFHVDPAGLIRRHDYTAQPVGAWAHAAHYCDDHRDVAGLVFPARRRVVPRGPGDRSLPGPVLVALDIDHIEIEQGADAPAGRRGAQLSRLLPHRVFAEADHVAGGVAEGAVGDAVGLSRRLLQQLRDAAAVSLSKIAVQSSTLKINEVSEPLATSARTGARRTAGRSRAMT